MKNTIGFVTLCEENNAEEKAMKKFQQEWNSINLAYKIGVFSKEYARNKYAILYAKTFGVASGIYRELALVNFEECFN